MMNGIQHALPENNSLISYMISGCPTVIGLKRSDNSSYNCGAQISSIIGEINKKYPNIPVLIVNRINALFGGETENDHGSPVRFITKQYSEFNLEYRNEMQNAYINTLAEITKKHPVYVTRPTPEASTDIFRDIPSIYAKSLAFGMSNEYLKIPYIQYQKRAHDAWQAQDIAAHKYGIHVIDLSKFFCDQQYCYFTKNGKPLMRDDDHMAWSTSLLLTPIFKKEIFYQE